MKQQRKICGMSSSARRNAGRPATPLLSRSKIAQAALELVAAEGTQKLTMSAVATQLGVAPSALYNHITGKTQLTMLLQDAVMSQVDTAGLVALAAEDTGSEHHADPDVVRVALRDWGTSYRNVFASYPSLITLIATMPVAGAPATRQMYDVVAAGLSAAGVPRDHIVSVIVGFESFLFGSAIDVHAPADIFQSPPDEMDAPVFRWAVEAFTHDSDTDHGPDAARGPADQSVNPYADAPFRWGLNALIEQTLGLIETN